MINNAEKLEKVAMNANNAAQKTYSTLAKKQKLNTSTVAKVVGGLSCRKAGGTQQDY
jgi:hypothetical protein